jgi:Protein of unknown function (DUF3606)
MSTKGTKRGMPNRLRVNIHKPSELRAWARYWGCTQQNVRDAVKISGVMVADVRDWLRNNVIR